MGSVRAPSRRSLPLIAIAILLAVFWFGLDRTFGQLSRDGFIDRVIIWVDQQSGRLPGSTDLKLKHYTGVHLVDRFIDCGNIFLDNIISRSNPELSLYAIYSAGQLVSSYTVLVIEGLRDVNGHNVVCLTTVWGMLIQLFSYANVMPLYAILHLSITSPALGQSSTVRLRDPTRLEAIIPALIPGFFLVAVLASLPFQGIFLRSLLNVSFRYFPILVAFWQFLATKVLHRTAVGQYCDYAKAERDAVALGHVYDFTRTIAILGQAVPLAVITVAQFFPGNVLDDVTEKLTFTNVFLPSLWHEVEPFTSAAKTMHDFFICNQLIGSAAAIVWAATLFSLDRPTPTLKRNMVDVLWSITREIALAGPAGLLIWFLRERDQEVLGLLPYQLEEAEVVYIDYDNSEKIGENGEMAFMRIAAGKSLCKV